MKNHYTVNPTQDNETIQRTRLRQSFPQGYRLVETSSNGLCCGLYAFIESVKAQIDLAPTATLSDLMAIATPQIKRDRYNEQQFEPIPGNNFEASHVAAVLE